MIAYLDTNVFDHLYKRIECTGADIAGLRKAIYGRDLSIPLGVHVLEEILLNRNSSPQELVARAKLTLSLSSIRRMVKPCDQLIADDIRSYAATGEPDRPLVSVQIQNALTQGISELIESDGEEFSEEMLEALEQIRQRKEHFLQAMRVSQQHLTALLETLPPGIGFADYFQMGAVPMAERFAHHAGVLAACHKRGVEGLLLIPSVRTAIGVTLSFIYGQAFEDWTSGGRDSIDFLHAPSAAATAEVFVTNDTHLRQALARIPRNDLRPLSLPEFLTVANPTDYTH